MQRTIKTIQPVTFELPTKKHTAAYARVSANTADMLHSLSQQISYYSKKIQANPEWEFVRVYVDEGKTGTKDRPEFLKLIADCRNGLIDFIITKSVARFARNTVTTLQYVRELRGLGIGVFFEEENLNSLSVNDEFMLTVLAAYAQEQSLITSENCKWRNHKNYAEGRVPGNSFFGYRRTKDRGFQIIEEQAEIVRMIYSDYLAGMGTLAIAAKLEAMRVPTITGVKWNKNTVRQILINEKYCGDALIQKTYIADYLTKKKVRNKGQLPRYFVADNHQPIVSREVFKATQEEMQRRAKKYFNENDALNRYDFTSKIVCGNCGKHFRRRKNNVNTKYERITWQCGTYLSQGKTACMAKQIPEAVLEKIVAGCTAEVVKMTAYYPNNLYLEFADGTTKKTEWGLSDE